MSDATSVEAVKAKRLPNTAANTLPASFPVEIFHGEQALGAIGVLQDEFLSHNGNVLYNFVIKRGWMLPEAIDLAGFRFVVNGTEGSITAAGLTTKAPSVYRKGPKQGQQVPNTGGEPQCRYFAMVDIGDAGSFMVNITVTKLHPKAGKPQGFMLAIRAMPRAVNTGGPQVIGEVEGLLIEQV